MRTALSRSDQAANKGAGTCNRHRMLARYQRFCYLLWQVALSSPTSGSALDT